MSEALQRLFDRLPMSEAMSRLVPDSRVDQGIADLADQAVQGERDKVQAGLWLYIDDLDRSHRISQSIEGATGAYWHGIMHRREGDFSNSKYWFRQVGSHPVVEQVGYDPFEFVDECARRHRENPAELVDMQRKEWKALFDWCLQVKKE